MATSSATPPSTGASPDRQLTDSASKTSLFYYLAATAAAIGVAAFWYAFSAAKGDVNPVDKIAYLIGYYFWVPLVVYAVWRSSLKRRKGAGLLLGSVAFLAIALYQSQSIVHQAEIDRNTLTAVHSMLLELAQGKVVDRAELLNTGEYSPFLLAVRSFQLKVKNDCQQYQAAVAAANLGTMLSPKALASASSVTAALTSLDEVQRALTLTDRKVMKDYDGMSTAMQSTRLPESTRQEVMSGFDKGVARGKAAFKRYFAIEQNILTTTTNILKFMRARQGFFAVRGDSLMFARPADLVTYNAYLAQLRSQAAEESAWRTAQHNLLAKKADVIGHDAKSIGH